MKGKKADGDMKSFARDLMPMNEATPVSVNRNQAQRAR